MYICLTFKTYKFMKFISTFRIPFYLLNVFLWFKLNKIFLICYYTSVVMLIFQKGFLKGTKIATWNEISKIHKRVIILLLKFCTLSIELKAINYVESIKGLRQSKYTVPYPCVESTRFIPYRLLDCL